MQALEANTRTYHSFFSPMREGRKEKRRKEESTGNIPDTHPFQLQVRILHDLLRDSPTKSQFYKFERWRYPIQNIPGKCLNGKCTFI